MAPLGLSATRGGRYENMTYKPRWLPQLLKNANKTTVKRDPMYYFKTQNRVFIKPQSDLLKG